MPSFPPPLPSLPIEELNHRHLSVPTNMPAGMVSSNSRDVQFESKTWGQTSCFTSQPCPGRQTHYTQHTTPSRHWDLHLASLQELGIWPVVSLWHTSALWKSIQPSLLSPKSLIPHITDLLFMHIILSTTLITSWDWEMQPCPELTSAWGRGKDHSRLSQFLGFWLGWFNAHQIMQIAFPPLVSPWLL